MSLNRKKHFDCMRALCMIWIICIWHMGDYSAINVKDVVGSDITMGVLAAYMFISGSLSGKYTLSNTSSAISFLQKRFIRIYPLFFVSCISLYLANRLFEMGVIVGLPQLVLTLTGLSCIFLPAPSTVWFVSLLLLFYLFTLIICRFEKRKHRILTAAILYAFLWLLHIAITIDTRVLFLYPVYCLGILTSDIKFNDKPNYILMGISGVLLIMLECLRAFGYLTGSIMQFICAMPILVFLNEIGKLLASVNIIYIPMRKIDYLGYCAYLFHRQVFSVTHKLWGDFSALEIVIAIAILATVSYICQKSYDFVISRLKPKKV